MITVQSLNKSSQPGLFQKYLNIRNVVFVLEQGVPENLEYDEFDDSANHYLAMYNNLAIGTARWRETKQGIKLERFAVLTEFRSKGIGYCILEKILQDVIPLNKKIYLHSQVQACGLYQKAGFQKQGAIFYEAGMAHFKMVLNIDIYKKIYSQ